MNQNEIQLFKNSSLEKVEILFSLSRKLSAGDTSLQLILYDYDQYKKDRELEISILKFIVKNFWYYINPIKEFIIQGNCKSEFPQHNIREVCIKNDLPYEYPRSFFRLRGTGSKLVDKAYDKKILENGGSYYLCSPPLNEEFNRCILDNINSTIAGAFLMTYMETSIGNVVGIKRKNKLDRGEQ